MQDLVIWGSFGVSIAVALAAGISVRDKLFSKMGSTSWSFSQSWASNITVVSGLVGITVLGYIPKEAGSPILLESQYKILFLIFVLFAALAPLVYNFSRHTEVKGDQIIANGKAFMFILASVFTIWSSTGQLATQALLIQELRNAKVLESSVSALVQVTLVFIILGLIFYAVRTMIQTVNSQTELLPHIVEKSTLATDEVHTRQWTLL